MCFAAVQHDQYLLKFVPSFLENIDVTNSWKTASYAVLFPLKPNVLHTR